MQQSRQGRGEKQSDAVQQMVAAAQQRRRAGDLDGAIDYYKQALELDPDNGDLHAVLGQCQMARVEFAEARSCFRRAVKLRPSQPAYFCLLARAELICGDPEAAMRAADEALKLAPGNPLAVQTKVELLRVKGDVDEAFQLADAHLARGVRHAGLTLAFAEMSTRFGRGEEAIERLRNLLRDPAAARGNEATLLFRLADLCDRTGQYDEAFKTLERAFGMRPTRWDPDAGSRQFDEMIEATPKEVIDAMPKSTVRTELPVFIVGMPRSGTSLVEQILASHPGVYGAGERRDISLFAKHLLSEAGESATMRERFEHLSRKSLDNAARMYLNSLRSLAPEADRVTDKMPSNFLHLGVIAAMLPGARVIHCVRDPRDTCLSCLFTDFAGVHPYTYNVKHLGRFYADYRRLMQHWKEVLPLPILDVEYESLVQEAEPVIRQMLDFLGLDWDDACLHHEKTPRPVMTASVEQARRPIYTSSIGRWKHYEDRLAPLIEQIETAQA